MNLTIGHTFSRDEGARVLRVVPAGERALHRFLDRGLERLAHLERHEAPEPGLVLLEQPARATDHGGTVSNRRDTPRSERRRRALEALVDVGVAERVERTNGFAG